MPRLRDLYDELVTGQGGLSRLDFNLLPGCNLDCVHCYRRAERDWPGEVLTTEEIIRALEEGAALGAMWTTWSGGEPLLRRDLYEILGAADGLGYGVAILTNGTLLDERRADLLADYRVYRVQVTLLGDRPEVHDRIVRVPGAFERTVRGIRNLVERNVPVVATFTVLAENAHGTEGVYDLAQELGVGLDISLVVSPGLGGDLSPLGHVAPEPVLREAALAARRRHVALHVEEWDRDEPSEAADPLDRPLCNAGRTILAVNWDGSVWPCIVLPIRAGHIRESSLSEIWRQSPELEKLRRLHQRDREACLSCPLRQDCHPCPAHAYMAGKGLLGVHEVQCQATRLIREADQELAQDPVFSMARKGDSED